MTTNTALIRTLILVALSAQIASGTGNSKRRVRWYTSAGYTDLNEQWALNHSDVWQGEYACCHAFGILHNGSLAPGSGSYPTKPKTLNHSYPVFAVIGSKGADAEAAYQNADAFAAASVNYAKAFNLSGYDFDLEPNIFNATHYATLLNKMADALHADGRQLAMNVAGWGVLEQYSLYAKTRVDTFAMMSTYDPANATSGQEKYINDMLAGGMPPEKISAGISTSPISNTSSTWNEASLTNFVDFLIQKGIGEISVWWVATSAAPVKPFFFEQFRRFVNAPAPLVESRSSGPLEAE